MIEKRISLTEGVLLAGVPVVGYWLAFLYQKGYAVYFYIPSEYIEVNVAAVLAAIVGMLSVVGVLYFLFDGFYTDIFSQLPRVIQASVLKIAFQLFIFLGLGLLAHWDKTFLMFCLPLIVYFVAFEFIFPLISRRDVKGYVKKLEARQEAKQSEPSLLKIYDEKFGRSAVGWLVTLFILSYLAYFSGGVRARIQTQFAVIKQEQEMVVLRQYGDAYVAAEFDRQKGEVYPRYRLLPISAPAIKVTYEDLGQLMPVKISKPAK